MKNKELFKSDTRLRIVLIVISSISLGIVFLGQRWDYSALLGLNHHHQVQFITNRVIRFLINDNLVLLLIYAIFYEKKYVKFGLAVEAIGFFFLLIPYFILKYSLEINPMYISFIHRLIINPTLMVLLIPAIYIQKNANHLNTKE
jgi:exosortase F-associated protein